MTRTGFFPMVFASVLVAAAPLAKAQIPPSITSQPQSQTADCWADVALTVSATGTEPLSYQWYVGGSNKITTLEDYNNIAGSHSSTLYLVGVGRDDAQTYSVVISNAAGSVTSSVAVLTVKPKVILQEDFANGLGQWAPLLDALPMGIDSTHAVNGSWTAMITNSAQKMYYRLAPKTSYTTTRLTMWIYDAGGPQMAYGELRGYSGETGYAEYVRKKGAGLRLCFAAGIYTVNFGTNNTGSLAGEVMDPTRYQGRVMDGENGTDGWFNLNAQGAPVRSPGWHKFEIARSLTGRIIDFYVDGVLAREIDHVFLHNMDTVTLGSTGLGESKQWPVVPVSAWFADVTVETSRYWHEYQSLASHGPIPDLMQLRETGTDASVVGVSPVTVSEASGAATNSGGGAWFVANQEINSLEVRGPLEYAVNAPADSAYRIEVEGREKDYKWPQMEMKLKIRLDGEELGRVELPYGPSSNGLAHCFTPYIRAGSHTVEIYWDNAHPHCALTVHAVRLQSLTGGAAVNGMPAWVANRLLAQCGMDSPPSSSLVSPVCLEGRGAYLTMMTVNAGTSYPLAPVTVHHGAGNRWYANVPLSPNQPTRAEVSYQNGGLTQTNDILWKVTNLLDAGATNAVIRKGDSLLFTALPGGASNGAVSIQVGGGAASQTDAGTPVPCQFNAAGTYTVTGTYQPTGANASITVSVVDASFNGPLPSRLVMKQQYWDCTNLPPAVVVESDPRLNLQVIPAAARAARLTNAPPLDVNGRELGFVVDAEEPRCLVARLGAGGPILADTAILGFSLTVPPHASLRILSTQGDGSQVIEGTYVLNPVVPGISLRVNMAAAGLTFDDGTLTRTLTSDDFNDLGVCRQNFIRAAGVGGSVCMVLDLQTAALGRDAK